eukprot:CAMPEP_0194029760 /NCGR_PEP_ID=MMETSP0009_2-20130614/3415_1 /TAXON_ID=210454 /ORGANISM="Grammatophora oceanica, Strain CCMP 410" /LENGTH=555 /DNA_ID=CAMNT_0038669527 /DNA_START=495 /DNA_END=2159 /DNA_ORIENTATION=+
MDQYTMFAMQAQQQQAFLMQQQQQLLRRQHAVQQQQQQQQMPGGGGAYGIPGGGMPGMQQQQQQFNPNMPYPTAGIDYPGMNDVMCGRGGGTNNHIGNIRFRQLVNEHKLRYLAAPKVDKPKVAMEVVQIWRRLEPPGRFLTKTDASQGDDSLWHDVGDKKAREKASQCLRERTPDVMPFVKQLQEQERKKKEEEKRKKAEAAAGGKSPKGSSDSSTVVGPSSTVNAAAGVSSSSTQDSIRADTVGSSSAASLPPETVSSSIDPSSKQHSQHYSQQMSTASASAAASSEATPDVTVSSSTHHSTLSSGKNDMGPPLPKGSSSKKSSGSSRRSREDLMDRVPTAAALSDDIFFDGTAASNANAAGLSLEDYQSEMQNFLENAPKASGLEDYDSTSGGTDARSLLMMETMSANSWVKSFQSIGSNCDQTQAGESTMMMSISESLRDIDETTMSNNNNNNMTTTTPGSSSHSRRGLSLSKTPSSNGMSSRSQKLLMKEQQLPSISMLSDLTDFSRTNKSTRSSKLQGSKAPSNFSMLSELTDLSEGLKEMDLAQQQQQ